MSFNGFTNKDFDTFKIDGFEARMDALKTNIKPKLEKLGDIFAPTLTAQSGVEMFPHVARHARRTVNPPKDTWVAFSSNKRGYKMLPHFQIGLWETHIFICFAVIYEANNKVNFGYTLEENIDTIYTEINDTFVWSQDHTRPDAFMHKNLSKNDLRKMFQRLQTVKKAEILCGYHIPRDEAVTMNDDKFIKQVETVFEKLITLYHLAR